MSIACGLILGATYMKENFISTAQEAKAVGGIVYGKSYLTATVYQTCLELFDQQMLEALRQDLAASPFEKYCVGCDFKDHIGVIRFYFFDPLLELTTTHYQSASCT